MAKETQKKQAPNRKKMARVERDRLQNRIITISAIVLIASVFLVIIGGVLFENVIKPSQPVAVVNGEEIGTTDYQRRVRYERVNLINNYSLSLFFSGGNKLGPFVANSLSRSNCLNRLSRSNRLMLKSFIINR